MYDNKRIDVKQLENYRGIIPDCYMAGLLSGEYFAIETFDDLSPGDPPVGIAVMGVYKNWAKILWYVLSDAYDDYEYAADLIRQREFDARSSGKAAGIFARIPVDEETDDVLMAFRIAGFETELIDSNTLEFTLGDIDTTKLMKVKNKTSTIFVSEADESTLKNLSQRMALDMRDVPVELPVEWGDYEGELSVIHLADNEADGALLVAKKADDKDEVFYEVALAYASVPNTFFVMLSVLVDAARNSLPDDTRVVTAILDNRILKAIKLIAPGAKNEHLVSAVKRF